MALGFFSRLKEGLTRSTQKLSTGTVPHSSVTKVNVIGQRARRDSRNAVTRKIM